MVLLRRDTSHYTLEGGQALARVPWSIDGPLLAHND